MRRNILRGILQSIFFKTPVLRTQFLYPFFKTPISYTYIIKKIKKLYKKLRNELTHRINKAKQSHYHKLLDKSKNDIKQTWNVINDITKKRKRL